MSTSSDESKEIGKRIRLIQLWPFGFAVILLLLAIPIGWPYGFYELLQWVVCGIAIYGSVKAHKVNCQGWMLGLIGVAVFFNPLIPVHFKKSHWAWIDFFAAGYFGVAAFYLHKAPPSVKGSSPGLEAEQDSQR